MATQDKAIATAPDVARYFLFKANEVGDLVTNLKMQKLIYYAYAYTLVRVNRRLFSEKIEAWPNGPVVPSLYQELKRFGSSPISVEFFGDRDERDVVLPFPADILEMLDKVYEDYGTQSAFSLVVSTHHEKPWIEARKGSGALEMSGKAIKDAHIRDEFSAILATA